MGSSPRLISPHSVLPVTVRVLAEDTGLGGKHGAPSVGSSSALCPASRNSPASRGGPGAPVPVPNPLPPRAGVQRGPAELSAGQIDLTGVSSPYSMFNMTYKEEDFDRLVQLCDYNVQSSQDTILQALRTVLKNRAPEARSPRVQT